MVRETNRGHEYNSAWREIVGIEFGAGHVRPRVLFSRCLGFAACRYNGQSIRDETVEALLPFVDPVTVCPEVEIGLGIPRTAIRLVGPQEAPRLLQPETGLDVTDQMARFTEDFLARVEPCDGAILKGGSPSCGQRDVRLYASVERGSAHTKTCGAFGGRVLAERPQWAVEDEGRLRNYDIRQHFLTRLFAVARYRAMLATARPPDLVAFHARHKLLLMAYRQNEMRSLGRLVANAEGRPFREVLSEYVTGFSHALSRAPRAVSAINVLQHAFGYVSDHLDANEKAFFLTTLDDYRAGRLPLAAPVSIMRSLVVRFDVSYLKDQIFFEPFPTALVAVIDSGKGRATR
jgi:uncharacterized protein YbgA (DUF1722 family)/uncharacterized protein YbbK (DUF523 family)